ncbi:MAG TPA: tetratricopeptide repeat protein [Chryseolinea sp.]
MKLAILYTILVVSSIDPAKIGRINTAKSEAKKAYNSGDYKTAIERYTYLLDSLGVTEDEITLNLANSYFQINDTASAAGAYQSIAGSVKPRIRSSAQHQLGVLNHRQGKFEEALSNFKQAIKADANNTDARYNYEMLKKKLDEQKKKDQKNNNAPKEPSEYAKKLKAQAEALSAQFRFREAQDLMLEGAKKDPSVMYYGDFIERLKNVVTINKK